MERGPAPAARAPEHEVAVLVGAPGFDERELGGDGLLVDVRAPVHDARLLRLRRVRDFARPRLVLERHAAQVDHRARARRRVEARDACSTRLCGHEYNSTYVHEYDNEK